MIKSYKREQNPFRRCYPKRLNRIFQIFVGNSIKQIVNESVEKDFMKTFRKESSHSPQLVYHGTKSDNIGSILQYGFLIPAIPHATNTKAP